MFQYLFKLILVFRQEQLSDKYKKDDILEKIGSFKVKLDKFEKTD